VLVDYAIMQKFVDFPLDEPIEYHGMNFIIHQSYIAKL
jgi:hypothetical protein